jgi:malate dehydrogenase (oxaloacetate-decarboxylating)
MLGQVVSDRPRGRFIGAVDFVEVSEGKLLRDATVDAAGPRQWEAITAALDVINGVRVVDTINRTFLLNVGGKIDAQ